LQKFWQSKLCTPIDYQHYCYKVPLNLSEGFFPSQGFLQYPGDFRAIVPSKTSHSFLLTKRNIRGMVDEYEGIDFATFAPKYYYELTLMEADVRYENF